MEPLWRPVVAIGGSRSQTGGARKLGRVDGSSPSEGFAKALEMRFSCKRSGPSGLSAEGGYWVAAGVGGDDLGEVGEERLFAEPAGDRGGEESLRAAFAALGLAAE